LQIKAEPSSIQVIAKDNIELQGSDAIEHIKISTIQWLDALTEYVAVLNTDIRWQPNKFITFVIGKYGNAITESGDIGTIAYVQLHLEVLRKPVKQKLF